MQGMFLHTRFHTDFIFKCCSFDSQNDVPQVAQRNVSIVAYTRHPRPSLKGSYSNRITRAYKVSDFLSCTMVFTLAKQSLGVQPPHPPPHFIVELQATAEILER